MAKQLNAFLYDTPYDFFMKNRRDLCKATSFCGFGGGGGTGTVTSVGISMPSAFTIAGSPITSSGTLSITMNGTTSQYLRGDGSLATFPTITNTPNLLLTATNASGIIVDGSNNVITRPLTGFTVGDNTAIVATDTILSAFEKVQGQIEATKTDTNPTVVGTVYSKDTWTNLTDFTVNSAGATISGGKILIPSGGVSDFSKNLQLADYSCINNWKFEIEFQLTVAPAAGTTGISIGLQSANSTSLNSIANYFRMSTSDNTGRMQFFGQSNNGSFITYSNAPTNLTFAQNDNIRLSLERNNQIVTLRAENLTNPVAYVEFTYTLPLAANPIPPNTGHFTIYTQGGDCTINKITVINKEIANPEILFLGDSKTLGYGATSFYTTYPGILGFTYSQVCISAGFGDKTSDILNRLPEVLAINPKQVVLAIGSNDIRTGVSEATFEVNYTNIVNQLTNAGIQVIHLSPTYESTLDLTTQYNFIKGGFTPFVDVFYTMRETGNRYTDNIHLSVKGNQALATSLRDSNLLLGAKKDQDFYDIFGKAPLASPALTGVPTAPTATAGNNTTQIATTAFVTNAVTTAKNQLMTNGPTESRPTGSSIGQFYLDTTIGKPLWYNGTDWIDATGTVAP